MKQLVILMRKDFKRSSLYILSLLLYYLFELYYATVAVEESNSPATALVAGMIKGLLWVLVVGSTVQSDKLHDESLWLMTKPLPRSAIFASKFLLLSALVIVIPTLLEVSTAFYHFGFSFSWGSLLVENLVVGCSRLFPLILLASISKNLSNYFLRLVVISGGVSAFYSLNALLGVENNPFLVLYGRDSGLYSPQFFTTVWYANAILTTAISLFFLKLLFDKHDLKVITRCMYYALAIGVCLPFLYTLLLPQRWFEDLSAQRAGLSSEIFLNPDRVQLSPFSFGNEGKVPTDGVYEVSLPLMIKSKQQGFIAEGSFVGASLASPGGDLASLRRGSEEYEHLYFSSVWKKKSKELLLHSLSDYKLLNQVTTEEEDAHIRSGFTAVTYTIPFVEKFLRGQTIRYNVTLNLRYHQPQPLEYRSLAAGEAFNTSDSRAKIVNWGLEGSKLKVDLAEKQFQSASSPVVNQSDRDTSVRRYALVNDRKGEFLALEMEAPTDQLNFNLLAGLHSSLTIRRVTYSALLPEGLADIGSWLMEARLVRYTTKIVGSETVQTETVNITIPPKKAAVSDENS